MTPNQQALERLEDHVRKVVNNGSLTRNLPIDRVLTINEEMHKILVSILVIHQAICPHVRDRHYNPWPVVCTCDRCHATLQTHKTGDELKKAKADFTDKHIRCFHAQD